MQVLGKYQLLRVLATGGMGEVLLARQSGFAGFSKDVVIKRILPHLARDPRFVEQFLNEARLAALLNHPNVVQVFDLGAIDGTYFLAMEYVDGRSLRSIQRRLQSLERSMPVPLAIRVCADALRGLEHAHSLMQDGKPLRIVHRDVSPENILVSYAGTVKVVDFGLAKALTSVSTTKTGEVRGKLSYMAPERFGRGVVDARTDVYAVGAVLFELLADRMAFEGADESEIIGKILFSELPSAASASVPSSLWKVVERAMAKSPDARFASAGEMAEALELELRHLGGAAPEQLGAFLRELFAGDQGPIGDALPDATASLGAIDRGSAALSDATIPQVKEGPDPVSATVPLRMSGSREADASARRGSWARAAIGAAVIIGLLAVATVADLGLWRAQPTGRAPTVPAPTDGVSKSQSITAAPIAAPTTAAPSMAAPSIAAPSSAAAPGPAPRTDDGPAQTAQAPSEPAPRPSRTAPAHSTRRSSGQVTFFAKPWAEVRWKGRSLGVTPIATPVAIPAGRQTFTFHNDKLGLDRTIVAEVRAGAPLAVKVDLSR